jgi:hypothetical protein
MSIGAFSGIVPVTMRANTPPAKTPKRPPDPDVGARWGRASTFIFSGANPEPTVERPVPPAPFVRNSTKHKYETRVESIPSPAFTQFGLYNPSFEDYFTKTQGGTLSTQGRFEADGEIISYECDLGIEAQQEIAGFTAYPDGSVVERYKTINVHRILSITLNKTPPSPLPGGLGHTEGAPL